MHYSFVFEHEVYNHICKILLKLIICITVEGKFCFKDIGGFINEVGSVVYRYIEG